MKGLTIAELKEKYGVQRRVVTELIKSGFVQPQRGSRREYRFAFRDVVLMRMAQDLYASRISPKKTTRFLQKLRRELPDSSFANLRMSTAGTELVVRQDGKLRNAAGQLVLDFAGDSLASLMPFSSDVKQEQRQLQTAEDRYRAALLLEQSDPLEAVRCYREAIVADNRYEDAYVNLGCLLLDQDQALEACIVLEEGAAQCANSALVRFNLGIAYEEMGRKSEAIRAYEDALRCNPHLADAHFNLARLHHEMDHKQKAIRHFNAYRTLGKVGFEDVNP